MYSVETLDEGLVRARARWSRAARDLITLLRTAHDLKHELLTSGIFPFNIFAPLLVAGN